VFRIIKRSDIALPIGDPLCGLVMDYLRYVLAKGHVILSIGWPGNAVAKMGHRCGKYSKGSTATSISWPSWYEWPNHFAETCSRI
jgi:hypothetical protein